MNNAKTWTIAGILLVLLLALAGFIFMRGASRFGSASSTTAGAVRPEATPRADEAAPPPLASTPAPAAAEDPSATGARAVSFAPSGEGIDRHGALSLTWDGPDPRDVPNEEYWRINGGRIFGKVILAQDSSPVSGAIFEVRRNVIDVAGSLVPGYYGREARSNENGDFEIRGLPPGQYRIVAMHAEKNLISTRAYDDMLAVVISAPREQQGPIAIPMVSGAKMRIKVTSLETGAAIEGATAGIGEAFVITGKTDANGEVVIGGLMNWPMNVVAWADGYAKVQTRARTGLAPEFPIEMALPPGGSVFGRISDAEGDPVIGATVSHRTLFPNGSTHTTLNSHQLKATSGADGQYKIDHLALDRPSQVQTKADGFADLTSEQFEISKDERSKQVDLTLAASDEPAKLPGSIVGTVTSREGVPVSGANIQYRGPGSRSTEQYEYEEGFERTVTDGAGRFRLDDLDYEGIQGTIGVLAKEYAWHFENAVPGSLDRPTEVAIQLDPGHWVGGVVVDERDRGVQGVEVLPRSAAHGYHGSRFSTYTGPSGEFRLENVPETLRVSFYYNVGPRNATNQTLQLDTDENRIVLPDPWVKVGRIVDDATGEPINRFRINGAENYHPNGEFRIDRNIRSTPQNLAVATLTHPPIVFPETVSGTDFDIKYNELRVPRGSEIFGSVVDGAGRGIEGVEVTLLVYQNPRQGSMFNWNNLSEENRRNLASRYQYSDYFYDYVYATSYLFQTRRTDRGGAFHFVKVPVDGRALDIAVTGDRIARQVVEGIEGRSRDEWRGLRIQVASGGRVIGRVNRRAYPNIDAIILGSTQGGGTQTARLPDPSAENFEFESLPPGQYSIGVNVALSLPGPGGRGTVNMGSSLLNEQFELQEGEDKFIEIGYAESFNVAGRVFFGDEPMVEGAVLLMLGRGGGNVYRHVTTDLQGGFIIDGVLPGDYQVVAARAGELDYNVVHSGPFREEIKVENADVRKDFVFAAPATVIGRLTNVMEARSRNARLSATEPSPTGQWANFQATFAEEGRFAFRGVTAGKYRLWVGLDAFNKTFPDVIEIPEGGGEFDLGELAIPTTRPVVGRITNLPGAPNPSISFVAASEELQGASSVATIREAGAFTASAVAPGTYNLTYYDQTQRFGQRVALQNVTIPPGDGEFDMGEFAIDLGGSLRVTLSGVLPEANGFVSLSLTGEMQTPSGVQTASFGSEMLRGAESVALFAGLNAGPIDVRVNAGGYFVAQSQYTAQIVSETVTELEIPLYPQTYLQITIAQQDITLSAVRLTSKETGQSMDLVPVERIGSEMANRPGAVFAPREIRVNGLAEGAWIVDATATDGRTARQEYEIRLRQGTVGGELTFGGAR